MKPRDGIPLCLGKEELASPGRPGALSAAEGSGVLEGQDPARSPNWDQAVLGLTGVNSFFSANWARVLKDSYGYQPMYLAAWQDATMTGCLPLMEIEVLARGRRGVALPFSDEVAPLGTVPGQTQRLLRDAMELGRGRGWRYLEVHGGGELLGNESGHSVQGSFLGHQIDLRKPIEELFRKLDGSIRRGIRAAERSGVQVEFTTQGEGMRAYYALHCLTRKRHGLPPQPWSFFKKIHECVLACGQGFVTLARHGGQVVAGAVFLTFGRSAIYKYGASDLAHQHLRPNNLVMWESIRRLVEQQMDCLNLGRTSLSNEGLRRFKQGWGSSDYLMKYLKYDYKRRAFVGVADQAHGWHNAVFQRLPMAMLRLTGSLLYRYCG